MALPACLYQIRVAVSQIMFAARCLDHKKNLNIKKKLFTFNHGYQNVLQLSKKNQSLIKLKVVVYL